MLILLNYINRSKIASLTIIFILLVLLSFLTGCPIPGQPIPHMEVYEAKPNAPSPITLRLRTRWAGSSNKKYDLLPTVRIIDEDGTIWELYISKKPKHWALYRYSTDGSEEDVQLQFVEKCDWYYSPMWPKIQHDLSE